MPLSKFNLISVFKATVCGYQTTFGGEYCEIYNVGKGEMPLMMKRTGNNYKTIPRT